MPELNDISLSIPNHRLVVSPGQRLTIPLTVVNTGSQIKDCQIKIDGVPQSWISIATQEIQIPPHDRLRIDLILAPPRSLQLKPTSFQLQIVVTEKQAPGKMISIEASLMLGVLTIQCNTGILIASSQISVSPGEVANIPFYLINLGKLSEQFEFAISGLDTTWFSLSETLFMLRPGERKRIVVSFHLPRGHYCRAGRHLFSTQITLQSNPEQPIQLQCSLTVGVFAWLSCELNPMNIIASRPAQVRLVNQGNIPQTCKVTLGSASPDIDFLPEQLEQKRILPGEMATVDFTAVLRHRNWFGGEITHPFNGNVYTSEKKKLALTSLVTSRSRIPMTLPGWLASLPHRSCHWFENVNWPLFIGGVVLFLLLFLSIQGPHLALQDPLKENFAFRINGKISRPPYPPFTIPGYPLGTDNFGRDLLSRILWGIRPTLIMVVSVALVRLVLGNLIGLLAGWSNGRLGKLLDGVISTALSIPILIVALMGITAVGIRQGLIAFIVGLALTGWADTARYVSTQTKIIKHHSFVEAARGLGASDLRILTQHVWKQLAPLTGMLFAFEISSTLFVVAELGFLGYFISGGTWIEISDFVMTNVQGMPELGQLLSSALVTLVKPTVLVILGTIIFFGILGFNLLGEGLRIRANRLKSSGGFVRRLVGERIVPGYDERYPLSVTDWVEAHAVIVAGVLAILLFFTFGLVWQNMRPLSAKMPGDAMALVVPGGQLWAAEKHDAQGTYWTSSSGPDINRIAWSYQAPGGFSGGPVVLADGRVVIATHEQDLVALTPAGDVVWQVSLPAVPVGSPALGPSGEIYVTSQDGSLLAFSAEGELRWQFEPKSQREASSGPVVDSKGNIFYTLVDTIQSVTPDGKSKWAAYASDVYVEQPPVLSAGESYIFLLDQALAAENGVPLKLDGLPLEELKFTAPEFFVGANQDTYLRSGHEIYGWKNSETGVEVNPGMTWPYDDYVVMPPVEQGVTPEGMAWMFYASDYNDTRMVWLDSKGKLIDNSRLADRQSLLIGVDKDLTAYICSNNYKANVRCEALQLGETNPKWTLEMGENISVVGGALIPGRMYIALDTGLLVAIGSQ